MREHGLGAVVSGGRIRGIGDGGRCGSNGRDWLRRRGISGLLGEGGCSQGSEDDERKEGMGDGEGPVRGHCNIENEFQFQLHVLTLIGPYVLLRAGSHGWV